jgi:predicted lactoylglutathione lyase
MYVSLPVTDLERAKAFYTGLGFTINPPATDQLTDPDGHVLEFGHMDLVAAE